MKNVCSRDVTRVLAKEKRKKQQQKWMYFCFQTIKNTYLFKIVYLLVYAAQCYQVSVVKGLEKIHAKN